VRREQDIVEAEQRIVGLRRLGVEDVNSGAGDPLLANGDGERGVVQNLATARVDQDRGRLHERKQRRADEVFVPGLHIHMQRDNVGLAKEFRFVDGRRREGQLRSHIEDVVVDHPHAEPMRGDPPDAPADAAHPDDADRPFIQLHSAKRVANVSKLIRRVSAIPEERPRTQQLQGVTEDKIADGMGVRIRRVDDFHAARPAGLDIDVLKAHAASSHDFEVRAAVEQSCIHLGVGAHEQTGGLRKCGLEFGSARRRFDNPGSLLEPGERRGIGVLGHQHERQFRHAGRYSEMPPEYPAFFGLNKAVIHARQRSIEVDPYFFSGSGAFSSACRFSTNQRSPSFLKNSSRSLTSGLATFIASPAGFSSGKALRKRRRLLSASGSSANFSCTSRTSCLNAVARASF